MVDVSSSRALRVARRAHAATEALTDHARRALADALSVDGRVSEAAVTERQSAAHALAQLATQVEAGRQLLDWAERVGGDDSIESLIAASYVARVADRLQSGVDLGGLESVPVSDLGLSADDVRRALIDDPDVARFVREASGAAMDEAIARQIDATGSAGRLGLSDELAHVRSEFARFANERVAPIAQQLHRTNALVPLDLIEAMGALGVFGLSTPEEYGGAGLGKMAMVVVTEELSRGCLGVGSLGTRSEIAAELILAHGTPEQRRRWLPPICSARVLPTAVFTEPNAGSDLASIQTRAVKVDGGWRIYGQKTWTTHAARADLMTLLARTDPSVPGHRGLSMFLAPKRRGDETNPFPDDGVTGSEIHVIGYRGMREYDLSFDGFFVADDGLLGGVTGQGFKQLMATFEGARIQTAARAVGVAQAAFDEALRYARARVQFGRQILAFPRIRAKLARAAVSIQAARQLTYYAARMKEMGRRCDMEAGMAKLLGARVAWEVADAAVQIHGGLGYAEETPVSRLLLDARVLSIFEGANEIQSQIIARRLLEP